MQPSSKGENKVYIFGPGYLTKMATMPIYGENLKKSSPEPLGDCLETWYVASVDLVRLFYINDDPGLILTYFMARSNLVP